MKKKLFGLFFASSLSLININNPGQAEVKRTQFTSNGQYLIVETLDDDLIHFEIAIAPTPPNINQSIYTSPMVSKTNYTGPSSYSQNGNTIETAQMKVKVNPQSLCISITDKVKNAQLTTICPENLNQDWKGLTLTKGEIDNVYGLGQQFKKLGSTDGDWLTHGIRSSQPKGQEQAHGNGFMPFGSAGMVGNVQFPILYGVGNNNLNYALFLDNVYKQEWNFTKDPWKVEMWGDQIRFYVMTGKNLPDLRQDYLELVGRPIVPPKKAFGLWVSEFGYKNWNQIQALRDGLRKDKFPVDGFVLDLQWFGGIIPNNPDSKMGKLDWDEDTNDGNDFAFPNPKQTIADFWNDGIGFVTIEESYINKNTSTFSEMQAVNLLAYSRTNNQCDNHQQSNPVMMKNWFGEAGMVDWSDPMAGKWMHENRRFPNMVEKGIVGHWTDLGEPEKYDGNACYDGVEITASGMKNQHGDVHNLYNLFWNKSIYEGYVEQQNKVNRRPFIVTRSGAPGSQRYGAAMWSGDIGSNLELLSTHLNSQMHMSFSGIDYYGSDIGGFRREGMPFNENHSGKLQYQDEMYTQWFANGSWFDTPVRPHTDNSFQTEMRYETSPHLVGYKEINVANLRQRYELIPYYYSLAYRANLAGEPVITPLVFYYQNDPQVRKMGHQKLIGKDILVAAVTKHGEYQRDIYLPKGKWINYHTNQWFSSNGNWLKSFPTYIDGIFRLPAFAASGAIIPQMYVDEKTKNAFGDRLDNAKHDELIVKIYPDEQKSQFTLYEDDGMTLKFDSYKRPIYQTRTTEITQQKNGNTVTVSINKADGNYQGAIQQRNNVIQLVAENASASNVTFNGTSLTKLSSKSDFDNATNGWYNAGNNLILVKSGSENIQQDKKFVFTLQPQTLTTSVHFICDNAWTNVGESVYVVGNHPLLGNGDINKSPRLYPNFNHEYIYNPPVKNGVKLTPKWTGLVNGLPTNSSIQWQCVKKTAAGKFENGGSSQINTLNSSYSGSSIGKL